VTEIAEQPLSSSFFSVVGHLALGAEFSAVRKLPPDLWPFGSRENVVDASARDHHGVGSSRGQRGFLLAIRDETILAPVIER